MHIYICNSFLLKSVELLLWAMVNTTRIYLKILLFKNLTILLLIIP
jgi:hypothetical protein